jgi:hypothetical protein
MMSLLMNWAESSVTPIVLLTCIGIGLAIEIWKTSDTLFMGDIFAEGYDD